MKPYYNLILLLAAGLFAMSGCKRSGPLAEEVVKVQVTEAVQRDLPIFKEFTGQLLGSEDVSIVPQVTGTLEGIHFKEGSEVKKGDLLYTIDPKTWAAKVDQARAAVAQSQALLGKATTDVKRLKPLAEANAIPQRDLDNAEANESAVKANVESQKAALREAQLNLGYCRISAPVNGTIGITQAKVGDLVGSPPAISVLNTISKLDPIVAQFSISEQEYLDLSRRFGGDNQGKPRDKIPLDLFLSDGSVYDHKGSFKFANRQIDSQTATLLLQASFPNPNKMLRPGLFAKVRIPLDQRKGAILVPQRAVQEMQGMFQVYTVGTDKKVQVHQVTPGPKVKDFWIIEKGLQAGDRVIVEGLQRVRPDQVVETESLPMAGLAELTPGTTTAAPAAPVAGKTVP